jgi:hypothetical protein
VGRRPPGRRRGYAAEGRCAVRERGQKDADEQAAIAVDVAHAEQARQEQEDLDRAAIDAARRALEALRKELTLRARMPADQRALEDRPRAVNAGRARADAQAARGTVPVERTAKPTRTRPGKPTEEQQRSGQRSGGTGVTQ